MSKKKFAYPVFSSKNIILRNFQSPGDIVMLTAAVRDLKLAYKDINVDVRTPCPAIWENNPYLTHLDEKSPGVEVIQMEYPLIHQSNKGPWHFIHGFRMFLEEKLNIKIPVTTYWGDIHISDQEKGWISQIEEMGIKDRFWIIMAGGKTDYTCKWSNPFYYQRIIDHFKGKITFVQCGEKHHFHPPLNGVVNLIGKTDLRQFIRLIYHSSGVLCPVTFAMHAAAAIEMKYKPPKHRPCVVVAGGREPTQWEAYPHHRYISMCGALDCCDEGGCWTSRCQKVGDGDDKDVKNMCKYPIPITESLSIPKCMAMIKPEDIIRQIEYYYEGGVLKYNNG